MMIPFWSSTGGGSQLILRLVDDVFMWLTDLGVSEYAKIMSMQHRMLVYRLKSHRLPWKLLNFMNYVYKRIVRFEILSLKMYLRVRKSQAHWTAFVIFYVTSWLNTQWWLSVQHWSEDNSCNVNDIHSGRYWWDLTCTSHYIQYLYSTILWLCVL